MIDDVAFNVRKLIRIVMGMPENSVRPAKQSVPAGGQVDEMATVDIISDDILGTPARSLDTVGTVPSDVTTERTDSLHHLVASVNFYRRPPTASYLRGGTVTALLVDFQAINNGTFDIPIDGVTRHVTVCDFTSAADMAAVAAVIQTRLQIALANARVAWDPTYTRFVVTSPTTGQTSEVRGAVPLGAGFDISTMTGLTVAAGALSVNNRAGIARYSNAAVDRATRLPQRLQMASAVALMNQLGLAFVSASPVRNLSALEDGTWESRGQVDLTFTVVNRETETITTIIDVPLTTHAQAPGGAIHTETAEVTA